tara:strand:- start:1861 stop:2313 length:453 start_codon:yes stop_codon:yes gene_type:complete
MNLNNILKKLITTEDRKNLHDYVFNMLLHNTDTAVLEYCIHVICEDKKPMRIDIADDIWFDPKDNMYDLEDVLMYKDRLIDANLMSEEGLLKGKIISDTSYKEECNPYAAEYKVEFGMKKFKDIDNTNFYKEIRVKRQNIWGIVEPEDLV